MSHPTKVDGEIKSLKILAKAAAHFGGTVDEKGTYKGWAGSQIKCDATVRNPRCEYEIGLKRKGTGKNATFEMEADLWAGKIEGVYGKKFSKLNRAYAEERIKGALRNARVTKRTEVGNEVLLEVSR